MKAITIIKYSIFVFLLIWISLNLTFGQTNPVCITTFKQSVAKVAAQSCETITVRVYIHKIWTTSGSGYGTSLDNEMITILDNAYNQYGISF